jgi:hypothetical protein
MDKPATRQTSLISNNKSLIDQKGKCSVKRLNILKKKKKKKKKTGVLFSMESMKIKNSSVN